MEACVGSTWGAIADNIQDAPTCVRGCRDSLRRLLAPSDETFEKFCRTLVQLDQPKRDDMLLGLYCCDSQLCGVDNIGLPGFDPNVDFIINVCSRTETSDSLGFDSIPDPGPPAATHVCLNTLLPSSDIACSRTIISTTTTSSSSATRTTSSTSSTSSSTTDSTTTDSTTTDSTTTQSTSNTNSSRNSTPTSTAMTSTSGTGAAAPSISSLDDPRLLENTSGGPKGDNSGGLSTASKIIIAVAVGAAILVALIAVLWHCRYRRKNRDSLTPNDTRPSMIMVPPVNRSPVSPNSQLVSPSPSYLGPDGEPLTPPPRLQDRRLLATGSSEQLIERAPSRLHQGFHLPTASRGGPSSPYGSTIGPPVAMTAAAAGAFAVKRQTPTPVSPNAARSPYLSPTRSQFATISYASSLADPGPPPNRDLPSTPGRATLSHSRSRSRADVSPNAIGVAIDFPPEISDLSTQVSNESGSSESKIMTGPMAGDTWRDDWVTTDDEEPAPLASHRLPTRRSGRSPVMERQNSPRGPRPY
ncbi:hypothetical protein NLG97_g9359 [Lecanicillium saksenae]|uniref:Uncharacterized protein n=1 Tax=Lecanicillium saksenae TaxID=468837 RepID=A0ACC1QGT2_9HYPO|nr:hypothetical protein NLG97_g9359 [Lecanicillium saksenae]